MFTIDNFIIGMQNSIQNLKIEKRENKLVLQINSRDYGLTSDQNETIGEIPIEDIQSIVDDIPESATLNDYALYNKTYFEVPIKSLDRMRMPPYRFFDRDWYTVSEHNYEFKITKASPKYIFVLMCFASEHPDINLDIHRFGMHNEIISSCNELCDLFRILTAKIISPTDCSMTEFKRMLHSYLFNISYNNNFVFSVSDLSKDRRPLRHGVRRTGQLFPYKSYNTELIKYYYQGASTDIPFTQYLAFYHVAEFFFQTIAEQDAFEEIRSFITRPSFSPYKRDDIRQFYNKIKKKMRDQRADGVWNEKTGLLLCLHKYVPDIDALKNSITSIDNSAVDYYSNNDVEFADSGNKINFYDTPDKIYEQIRNRVYSVRNALVHSKEGEKLRYEPFKHDKQLAKEIPLIRAVAEEIIINSSKPIEIKYVE